MLGLKKDTVSLCLIDEKYWSSIFEEEKAKITALLYGISLDIEHVGSTSIPGIMAKPIVDIAIGIKNIEDADIVRFHLEKGGYVLQANNGDVGRLLFIKGEQDKRTHHLHVEEYGQESWKNHIQFRDCLLSFPDLRAEYMRLKIVLAKKYPDNRKQYTFEKAEFIQKVLSKCRS